MSQIEWQQVKDIFYTALNRPVGERSDFLDSACGGNRALRSEVEVLLESYESGFLESPLLADNGSDGSKKAPLFEHGRSFSHYQILRLLGRGGMGEVYLANDLALDRLTAIKVIHGDSGFGDQSAERLVREAKSAAKLDHINICQVYEVGEADGHPFIAMQYVDGDMLDPLIGRGPISLDDAISYARQIAAALAKAHSWGIIHRDIKPSNVIIDSRKHLKVLDFGLAKETFVDPGDLNLSAVGLIAGTLTYMSPEHVRGQEVDGQTDIWSLGVVFYQMLTGRLPFRGETKADMITAILNDEIAEPGDIPPPVKYIIDRAMQKDRSRRYANIEEFDNDLAELAETGSVRKSSSFTFPGTSVQVASTTGPRPGRRRSYLPWAIATVFLLVIVGGGGFGVWRYRAAASPIEPFSGATVGRFRTSTLYTLKQEINAAITDLNFSPDGTLIAFGLKSNNTDVVYVKSLTGSEPVPVTQAGGINYSPVWSPDGQRLAYLSKVDGKISVWSVPFAGGDPLKIAELGDYSWRTRLCRWSNDGKRIFIEDDAGLDQFTLATGNRSPVDLTGIDGTVVAGIAVAPDESRVLVKTLIGGELRLWVKSLVASDAKRITEYRPFNGDLAWFPDSRRFIYPSDETGSYQLYVGNIDGSPAQQITSGSDQITIPAISPDGGRIAHVTTINEANLYSMDLGSLRETVITSQTELQILPAISPDGGQIAYSTATDTVRIFDGMLKIDPYGHGGSSVTLPSSEQGFGVKWSPGGDEIAFLRRRGRAINIWKYGLNDQKESQITTGGIDIGGLTYAPVEFPFTAFDLSPDGSRIVFGSKRSGQNNIWIVASDGSGESMLTDFHDGLTNGTNPIWSPSGDRVAFVETVGTGHGAVVKDNRVAIYRDGNVTIVGRLNDRITLLGWSIDGKGVYVSVKGDDFYDIDYVSADGNGSQRMIRLPNAREMGIRISPDQKWVVFTARGDDIDNVYVAPLDGGEPRRVTANTDTRMYYSGVTWSPDSKTLLYSKQTGGIEISLISNIQ